MLTQVERFKRELIAWRDDENVPYEITPTMAFGYFVGLGLSFKLAEESVRICEEEGLI